MPQQRTNARGTLIVQTCFCNFRNWGRPIKADFHIYGISFPRATVKECSDCHHAPSYAHRTCSHGPQGESLHQISFPSVRAFQQQHAAMNDVVLLACTTGDLSWLRQGISEGLDPCKRNAEVSQLVEKLFAFSSFGKLKGASPYLG